MGFMKEFKEFINRGNVMDMAVGVIVGGAFTSIVTSLTDDIINPFIKLVTGGKGTDVAGLTIPVPGTTNGIDFGAFISACINFLIVALIVFLLVKAVNGMERRTAQLVKSGKADEAEEVPPTCPYCLETVNEGARKCPHCGSDLSVHTEKDDDAKGAAEPVA
jgi:large conductance mechanosensitive channel